MASTGSGIYNHRSLQVTGPPGPAAQQSFNRLDDSFDAIRQEFNHLLSESVLVRQQRDEYESKITSQINELNIIRTALFELESAQNLIRKSYEEENARLQNQLQTYRSQTSQGASQGIPSSNGATSGPGAIGLPGSSGSSGPGGGPHTPFSDPYHGRDRGERVLDRGRERRERDGEQDGRETKRLKTGREDMFSPSLSSGTMPKLPPPGSASASASLPPPPLHHPPTPHNATSDAAPGQLIPITSPNGFPEDMDPNAMPPEYRKDGSDWFAIFNPKVKRSLDVSLVHTLMHESVVCCVRFSADGKYLATGCNRTAQIYDTKTGRKTCTLSDDKTGRAGDLYIRSVCFSPDGKFLATGAEDKQIRIWDIERKKIRSVFDGHQQEIYSLDFSLDGRLIVSGSGDKTARIWDMADGTSKVLTINDPDSLNNDAGVTSVAISPNGQLVAAGSLDTVVRIWDVATGGLVERLRGHRDSVYSVAFTPDGKGLISGSLDKTLKYWDVSGLLTPDAIKARKEAAAALSINGPGAPGRKEEKTSPCTMNFTGHKDYVLSVAVSHDGQWVVSGSKDRGVQFWDARTATVQCMLQGHKNSVISIDLSPAGNVLATGSGDWQARIWAYNPV